MSLSYRPIIFMLAAIIAAAGCGYNPKSSGNGIPAAVYKGTVECLYPDAGCHVATGTETATWEAAIHGNPDNSPSVADTGEYCANCHNPVEEEKNDAAFLFTSGPVPSTSIGQPERPIVGCEACHGTGMSHYAYAHAGTADDAARIEHPDYDPAYGDTHYLPADTAYSTFANPYHLSSCGPCHSPSQHAGGTSLDNILANQYPEWRGGDGPGIVLEDGHSDSLVVESIQGTMTSDVRGTPCAACHTVEGFVTWFVSGDTSWASSQTFIDRLISETGDADLADPNNLPGSEALSQVSCVSCHPSHEPGILIRSVAGASTGTQRNEALCVACHNVRELTADAGSGQLGTSSLEIPRHPQKELFEGVGANNGFRGVEFAGHSYNDSSHAGTAIAGGCVGCHYHLADEANLTELPTKATSGHTFRPRLENCLETCHLIDDFYLADGSQASYEDSTISTFNFGSIYYSTGGTGTDHDGDGTVEPLQTEITGLLNDLKVTLTDAGVEFDNRTGLFDMTQLAPYTTTERAAAYNYDYVVGDGSYGYHNPIYVVNLLAASLSVLP
jgi:hypothetical protein